MELEINRFLWDFYLIDEQTPATPDSGAQGELRAVISPDVIQVQNGQTVELTCTVYGADTGAQIYWIQDEPERVKQFPYLN